MFRPLRNDSKENDSVYQLIYIIEKQKNGKLNQLNFLVECVEKIIEEYVIQQIQTSKIGDFRLQTIGSGIIEKI